MEKTIRLSTVMAWSGETPLGDTLLKADGYNGTVDLSRQPVYAIYKIADGHRRLCILHPCTDIDTLNKEDWLRLDTRIRHFFGLPSRHLIILEDHFWVQSYIPIHSKPVCDGRYTSWLLPD